MNILQKLRWVKWKIRFGERFNVPIKSTFLGRIQVHISGRQILKLNTGFSCRDNVSFNLSGGNIEIGNNTFLNDGCKLNCRKRITIGNNCVIGQNVLIYDHDHDYHSLETLHGVFATDEVKIGNNVWIGSNVVILRGSIIGDGCVIGAGCIIKETIASGMLVYPEQSKVKKKIRGDIDT